MTQWTRNELSKQLAKVMSDFQDVEDERDAAERERDAALARAEKAERERDGWRAEWVAVNEDLKAVSRQSDLAHEQWQKWEGQARRAERERDAAVARADQLRDERDEALSAGLEALGAAESKVRVLEGERATQPAPAVSIADIQKVVADVEMVRQTHGFNPPATRESELVRRLWALHEGTDRAVYVVRESDLPEVERDEDGNWIRGDVLVYGRSAELEMVRQHVASALETVADCEAVARAIGVEAEQAVDPVEELTDNLADILYGDELVTDQMRGVLERVVRAGMLLPEQEADQ